MYQQDKPPDKAPEEVSQDYIRFLREEAGADPMLRAEYEELTKQRAIAAATANTPTGKHMGSAAAADTFDAAAFDALPLRDKLDRAAHASLAFKMALIASTDVATATDARIKAALSAAQSVILTKARVDEVGLSHAPGPDRTAEHLARWERLKRDGVSRQIRESLRREEAARAGRATDGPPVIAGSTSAITGNS